MVSPKPFSDAKITSVKWTRSAYLIHRGENQGHEMESKFSKVLTVYTKARTRGSGSSQHVPLLYYNSRAQQTPKTVASDVKEAEIGSQLLKSQPHHVSRRPESCLPTVLSLGVIFGHVFSRWLPTCSRSTHIWCKKQIKSDRQGSYSLNGYF